jgi:Protein of unknown function (DUF2971)
VTLSQWKCRLCGFDRHHRVSVLRKTGALRDPVLRLQRLQRDISERRPVRRQWHGESKRGGAAGGRYTHEAEAVKSAASTLSGVGKTVREIAHDLYAEQPAESLYHYTSIRGLLGIVPSGVLRATDVHYLSDAAEMRRTASLLRGAAAGVSAGDDFVTRLHGQFFRWLDNRLNELGHALFVGCFTANGNLLSQWRSYCDAGKGVSLGFASNALIKSAADQSWLIGKCIYDESEQNRLAATILSAVEAQARQEFPPSQHLTFNATQQFFVRIEDDLLRIAVLLKHTAFSEEQEWRIVSPITPDYMAAPIEFREGQSMLTPYMNFRLPSTTDKPVDLEHIWVGPTPHVMNSVVAVNNYLAKQHANPRCGVGYCGIPYRTW